MGNVYINLQWEEIRMVMEKTLKNYICRTNCKSTVGTVSELIYFSVKSIQTSANK
jgi:hypothetical protein